MRLVFRFILITALLGLTACNKQAAIPSSVAPMHATHFSGEHSYDYFTSADGLKIFGQTWAPKGQPRGLIIFMHGTALHSGTYHYSAERLAEAGYLVYSMDLRGWGRSEGHGKRGYVQNHQEYVKDVATAAHQLRAQHPGIPLYLSGESLGGSVAVLAETDGSINSDGLILSAPGIEANPKFMGLRSPKFVMSILAWEGKVFGDAWPGYPLLPVITNTAIRDRDIRKQISADPFVPNWVPAGYVSALVRAQNDIRDKRNNIDVPMLIVHGKKDNLIPIYGSEGLIENASHPDKTLNIYPRVYHTTLLDPETDRVLADIIEWLNLHSPKRTARTNR